MMHDIDKKLVVEGVETEETMSALEGMKCDYIQGYYYSRPLSEEDLVAFMKKHNTKAAGKGKAGGKGRTA